MDARAANDPEIQRLRRGYTSLGAGELTAAALFSCLAVIAPWPILDGPHGRASYLTFGGTGTYERVPWHARFGLHTGLLGLAALLSLLFAVAWPFRRTGTAHAWVVALVSLSYCVGLALLLAFGDLLLLFKEIPWTWRIVSSLPWIGGLLALALLARWRTAFGSIPGRWPRIAAGSVAVCALLLAAQAGYWRLWPW